MVITAGVGPETVKLRTALVGPTAGLVAVVGKGLGDIELAKVPETESVGANPKEVAVLAGGFVLRG